MPFDHIKNTDCVHCAKRFTNIFCNPGYDSVAEFNLEKICTAYKKGEYIFKEGFKPYGVFCVNIGKIKLVRTGDDGREQIIRLVKPGDPMGYRSLLSGEHYQASAIALKNCGVCFIPKELFLDILQKDSSLSMEMMKMLSDDLGKATMKLTNLAQKPVRERMAEAILFIKETYGFEADGKTVNASFSREDIANIAGTATETAIRLLSEFNKDGIVILKGKKILIPDISMLLAAANVAD